MIPKEIEDILQSKESPTQEQIVEVSVFVRSSSADDKRKFCQMRMFQDWALRNGDLVLNTSKEWNPIVRNRMSGDGYK